MEPSLRVVGAGFGRTGTLSLKLALESLGFGPCYHMAEVIRHPEHLPAWESATRGEVVDWTALFRGWGATVDWPACSFAIAIAEAHPEAKVVLGVREPRAWYRSCRATIWLPSHLFPLRLFLDRMPGFDRVQRMAVELIWRRGFGDRFLDEAHAIGVYEAHLAAVKAAIPADRLLVFDVREGWGPLCAFLGVPVPDRPFPHVNDTASMRRGLHAANALAWALLAAPVVVVAWAIGRL